MNYNVNIVNKSNYRADSGGLILKWLAMNLHICGCGLIAIEYSRGLTEPTFGSSPVHRAPGSLFKVVYKYFKIYCVCVVSEEIAKRDINGAINVSVYEV